MIFNNNNTQYLLHKHIIVLDTSLRRSYRQTQHAAAPSTRKPSGDAADGLPVDRSPCNILYNIIYIYIYIININKYQII